MTNQVKFVKNTRKFTRGLRFGKHQTGVVLIVALIMVLLMAIVGVAAIRGTGLQEMMAGNMRDMNLRFQSAEAGLRFAETHVDFNVRFEDLPIFNNANGFFSNRNIGNQPPVSAWTKVDWNAGTREAALLALQMPSNPRYVIEEILIPVTLEAASTGSGIDQSSQDVQEEGKVFRVSSYYSDVGTGAGVFVQSLYKH